MKRSRNEIGIRAVEFKSRSEAEAYLSGVADSVAGVTFTGGDGGYHIDYAGGAIGQCRLHRGSHSALSFSVKESDEFHVLLPLRSGLEFQRKGKIIEGLPRKSGLIFTPESRGDVTTLDAFSGISLFASASAVTAHAQRISGSSQDAKLVMGDAAPINLSDPLVDALGRNMVSVFREMMALGETGLNTLVSANFDELLLDFLSAVVSSTVRSKLGDVALDPGGLLVRRAQEYIRANANQPLRLSELAETLGVSLRSLQIVFKRELGYSPRHFLQRCRLDLAREQLLGSDKSAKVATIALDCGFSDLAHFSRTYREAFGELPSETLRRRKG